MSEVSDNINTKIGYKKLRYNLIAKLEIRGKNNQDRNNVKNVMYAKHRCSEALVLEIYDMFDKSTKKIGSSMRDPLFKYKVGEIVKPDADYDTFLNDVCSTGIHYFLTEEVAFFYELDPETKYFTGEYKGWYDNGVLESIAFYKNGERDGLVEEWYENGNLRSKTNYKNGWPHGLYQYWYINNQLRSQADYFDGNRNGHATLWHMNGKLQAEENFVHNRINGDAKYWNENGQLLSYGPYVFGLRNGTWHVWNNDKKEFVTENYVNGILQNPESGIATFCNVMTFCSTVGLLAMCVEWAMQYYLKT